MKKQTEKTLTALQFFGYRYPPFADTFEVHSPYTSDADDLILQRTDALLRQGKSLAVYGDAGSGKSMLIKSITADLNSKEFRVAQIPYGGIKPSSLLRDLCDEFDIDTSGRKNLLARLSNDFQRSSNKPFPVIVVDEAHEMQKQSFIDLCSLLHDTRQRTAAAALILVGQPVLKKMLELDVYAPVRTRLTCLFQMPKLSLEHAKEFIEYRLKIAQANPAIFDNDALENIAVDSKGNRRTLMNLASLCLEEAARRKDKVVTSEIVNSVTIEYQL